MECKNETFNVIRNGRCAGVCVLKLSIDEIFRAFIFITRTMNMLIKWPGRNACLPWKIRSMRIQNAKSDSLYSQSRISERKKKHNLMKLISMNNLNELLCKSNVRAYATEQKVGGKAKRKMQQHYNVECDVSVSTENCMAPHKWMWFRFRYLTVHGFCFVECKRTLRVSCRFE